MVWKPRPAWPDSTKTPSGKTGAVHRLDLKSRFGIPVKREFHTKGFILNKNPYRHFDLSIEDRLEIVGSFCEILASLDMKVISVCILKFNIESESYPVLDRSLTYLIQRIENDLRPVMNPRNKFMIITDEGRIGAMRKTARAIQRFNYVPSRLGTAPRRLEIQSLIEDPLPKNSKESHFIQAADLISFITYQYAATLHNRRHIIHRRLREILGENRIREWMDTLKPCLNTMASSSDPYGVMFYPQPR